MRLVLLMFGLFTTVVSSAQNVLFNDSTSRLRVISPSGNVSDSNYTEVSGWSEGRCFVNKGDLYGYIDTHFREITAFVYDDVSSFQHGFARVQRDSQFTFINLKGVEICPPRYESVRSFFGSYAPVQAGGRWGLLDSAGSVMYPCALDYPPTAMYPDFIRVCLERKWGVLNEDLQLIHPFDYDYIDENGRGYQGDKIFLLGR